ncbi:3'-5' exonuclease [Lignipirellula cremea]|uniref:Sporulation inhibitor KapD n=1 Tax=Lignipirellula cremea TaxID=2528010 RepID=A0A518E0U8_9BACT|nr:3'-5' exonuclease [Lignipirellula cremea]QDU97707.1 sporulation inhibitor KapD [Lignipirellula cremea]
MEKHDSLWITAPYYLIIDLEATCSDNGPVPRQEMEIIEIGAVLLDSRTFNEAAEFQTFVKPVRHPRLTSFCTALTSIRQDQVEEAPGFVEALAALEAWRAPYGDSLFCSWGFYDRGQFEQDCEYHQVAYPFGDEHLNLKEAFSEMTNQKRRFGIGGALRNLGLYFEGTPHRGIDDVRNIVRIIRQVCQGG